MKLKEKCGVFYVTSPLFDSIGIPHAFTTVRGGVSVGDFKSLNVSTRRKDSGGEYDKYENTVENFRRALSLVGAKPENSVSANQVHGNTVLVLDERYKGMGILRGSEMYENGDGLFLLPEVAEVKAICVKSADCTPVLFADRRLGSVCAVHSGWRGTCLDIVGEAVKTMIKHGSNLADIYCAVGPCIGACCYEVSDDVYNEALKTLKSKSAQHLMVELFINRRETENGVKYHFNIGKMCAELSHLAGVPKENIDFLDVCTCCSADENGRIFFSHRGQGGFSGTFASVITPFSTKGEKI